MNFINLITKTPLWIWAVLAFFIDIGLKSLHQHVVYLPRLFLIPLIMIILKYQDAFVTHLSAIIALFSLLIGCVIGIFFAHKTTVSFHKKAWSVQLPGSYVTFTFLAMFFSIKFLFEYIAKHNADIASDYIMADIMISALFTGYFLGRACYFLYKFYKT